MRYEQKVTVIADARISEIEVRWTMFMFFFAIHSGALSLIFVNYNPEVNPLLYVFICLAGLRFVYLWKQATFRTQRLIEDWNQKMADLESVEVMYEEGQEPKSLGWAIDIFRTPRGRVPSPEGVPLWKILMNLVDTFAIIWWVLLLYFLYQLTCWAIDVFFS